MLLCWKLKTSQQCATKDQVKLTRLVSLSKQSEGPKKKPQAASTVKRKSDSEHVSFNKLLNKGKDFFKKYI